MRNYVLLVLALVVFVIVFNSILGSKRDKMEFKQMQQMTEYCKQQGAVYYVEPGKKGVCVNMRGGKIQ